MYTRKKVENSQPFILCPEIFLPPLFDGSKNFGQTIACIVIELNLSIKKSFDQCGSLENFFLSDACTYSTLRFNKLTTVLA